MKKSEIIQVRSLLEAYQACQTFYFDKIIETARLKGYLKSELFQELKNYGFSSSEIQEILKQYN